jgi:hypothetical protein
MKIRSIALLAISIPACVHSASLYGAPLAIYYVFDNPPSAALVTEMQSEVNRVMGDAGIRVAWRAIESPRNGEDFPGIVFLRFRGVCSWVQEDAATERRSDLSGQSLAETEIANGHVLPFGSVDCDRLRRFLALALRSDRSEERNAALGRAIARVSAHEIYHMLTGSEEHARRGIARASHTPGELTAPAFAFARQQTDWLRAWAARSSRPEVAAAQIETKPQEAESTASVAGDAAGR